MFVQAAIKGAFFAEEMRTMLAEGRIRPIKIEKEVRVHTAWDWVSPIPRPSGSSNVLVASDG